MHLLESTASKESAGNDRRAFELIGYVFTDSLGMPYTREHTPQCPTCSFAFTGIDGVKVDSVGNDPLAFEVIGDVFTDSLGMPYIREHPP